MESARCRALIKICSAERHSAWQAAALLRGQATHLVFSGAGDAAVEFGAGVQVVVVGGEACSGQLPRLLGSQHAQRGAHLHAQAPDLGHHLQHPVPLPLPNLMPQHIQRDWPGRTVSVGVVMSACIVDCPS